jgi:uncharacterized protein YuzE
MNASSLTITYRKGKAMAAYLQLARRPGDKAAHTKEAEPGVLIDFAPDGRPIGIEIVNPSTTDIHAINRVLRSLNLAPVGPGELAPLTHAA